MINPPIRLLAAAQDALDTTPEIILAVPGREMWIAALVHQRHDWTLFVPDLDAQTRIDLRSAKRKQTTRNRPLPRWARHPAGVLVLLSATDLQLPGLRVVILGDEPPGPRYEYALGMAFATLFYQHNQVDFDTEHLLTLMEQVQRDYLDK